MSTTSTSSHREDVEREIAQFDQAIQELETTLESLRTQRTYAQYELNRLRREAGETK